MCISQCSLLSGCKAGVKVFHEGPFVQDSALQQSPLHRPQSQKKAELCSYTVLLVTGWALPGRELVLFPLAHREPKSVWSKQDRALRLGEAIRMCRKPETSEEKANCLEIPEERTFPSFQKLRVSQTKTQVNNCWSPREQGQR